MSSALRIGASLCAVGMVVGFASAQTAPPGTILEIDAELHGDWTLQTEPAFIPGSQGGHFGLDTLVVSEHVPGFVEDGSDPPRIPEGPGTRRAERWADLWVSVIREASDDPAMIAIDKEVFNWTPHHWTDFHMEVGTVEVATTENGFYPLNPVPGLDFKSDPAPVEETGKFGPAMFMNNPMGVPSLWWFAGSNGGIDRTLDYPGVFQQESASFWLGLNIPDSLFRPVLHGGDERYVDHEQAFFILRQHWTPTPGAAGLMAVAFGAMGVRRRRSN